MIEKINYLKKKDKYTLQLTKCCPIIFKHFAILVDPRYSARSPGLRLGFLLEDIVDILIEARISRAYGYSTNFGE